ncbi:phosphoglycerate dehydrogenase [bacterium]|nr:phosphoglycerate dehydrogenase [bacterium]MBU2600320.1 phosphoglycerate dehydrogenase [bacterium]
MKVLVSDTLPQESLELLRKEKDLEVDVKTKLSPQELISCISNYQVLLIRSGTKVTKEVINAASNLQIIGRAGVGIDNVDVEAATRRGIIVMNTPDGNTISTAEHTIALILSLSRNIPFAHYSLRNKEWKREKFAGVELFDKTIGIIGLGRIGTEVAKRIKAFQMRVIGYDPYVSEERVESLGIEMVGLEQLYKESDYITLHVTKTPETKNMISKKEIELMKSEVRIINCARGGLIQEQDLIEALRNKRIAGAALDVYEQEPPAESELFSLDNCITVPHLGASTKEAQLNVGVDIVKQALEVLKGGMAKNAINIPQIDGNLLNQLKPYLNLGEKLGSFQGQLASAAIEEVAIEYAGDMTKYDLKAVSIAILKGLLSAMIDDALVNFVNAPFLAKERGIKVVESKSSQREDFNNLISVTVKTNKGKSSIAATLFHKDDARLVYLENFRIDAIPSGYMLVLSNIDKPGVVGRIGTILGNNNINIAALYMGREPIKDKQILVINVDSFVPEEVISEIRNLEEILRVKLIRL